MSNELEEVEIKYEVGGQEVKLSQSIVSQFVIKGNGQLTQQEVVNFMQLAKFQKLNPFLNEIYLVKFGSQPAQMIVSKEAFMKRAEANENFRGIKAGIIVQRGEEIEYLNGSFKLPKDVLLGAWAEVLRSDRDTPTHVEIALEEFSKGQSTWKSMPATMIRKTAIVNALREAFPNNLGALYTEDDANLNEKQTPQQPKQARNVQVEDVKQQAADWANQEPETPEVKPDEQQIEQQDAVAEVVDQEAKYDE